MVIYKGTTHAYYPMSDKGPDLICGSRRIRYVRGFVLVNSKESGPINGSRVRPETSRSWSVQFPR
jgi:hypothetical protein